MKILASHQPISHPNLKKMIKIIKMRSLSPRRKIRKKMMSPRIRGLKLKRRVRVTQVITKRRYHLLLYLLHHFR